MKPHLKFLFLPFLSLLPSCANQVEVVQPKTLAPQAFLYQRESMHTLWNYTLIAGSEPKASAAFHQAAAEIDLLDNTLAMWKENSEVSNLNKAAGQKPVTVSAGLLIPLKIGLQVARLSKGAFDPTVGPLTTLWYYALQKKEIPSRAEIDRLRRDLVGYELVKVDESGDTPTVFLPRQGMKLDLGGIAKGYAQDVAAEIFKQAGIRNFLINAGGQIYAAGSRLDGKPWRVGIENPRDSRKVLTTLDIRSTCIATSGDYEQSTMIRGKRYHHIFDPKTGWPTRHGCISATSIVPIAQNSNPGALSDAIGTAAFVEGPKEGKLLLQDAGYSGVLVGEKKDGTLVPAVTDDLVGKVDFDY